MIADQNFPIRIGTRGSPLALRQATLVKELFLDQENIQPENIQIVKIMTTGDHIKDRVLHEFGGKGLFTKEIEEALFDRRIDIAVHSMKDVATIPPKDLKFACILPREDPHDAWLSDHASSFLKLPEGSRIGTASLRRASQILHHRPDLEIVTFRGNVDTRIKKLAEGKAEGTLLALAGLKRLQKESIVTSVLGTDIMLPAPAQGAIGLQCHERSDYLFDFLKPFNDYTTEVCIQSERHFLRALDGSCRTPIAALATLENETTICLTGLLASLDGKVLCRDYLKADISQADKIGVELANIIKSKMKRS